MHVGTFSIESSNSQLFKSKELILAVVIIIVVKHSTWRLTHSKCSRNIISHVPLPRLKCPRPSVTKDLVSVSGVPLTGSATFRVVILPL